MSIQAGLVGLPNVGKSTLFNALTNSQVPAENYPFCTIEPHTAVTVVPDPRMEKLRQLYDSKKLVPSHMNFVDIAGLVQGAASGEGLGNQFLSHIRAVDLIIHVLRVFQDGNITNTRGEINPLEDFAIITTELMLKDIESITKRIAKVEQLLKTARNKPTELAVLEQEKLLLQKLNTIIDSGDVAAVRAFCTEHRLEHVDLLIAKNYMIVANVSETELEGDAYRNNRYFQQLVNHFGADMVVPVSAKIESELAQLEPAEQQEMMQMLGIQRRGLDAIIQTAYKKLGLITFFTCGPQEIHAWPIRQGISIRTAAGEIHSDLERGFICAEVLNCQDLFSCGSIAKARETGKLKTEGQQYLVADGDIINVKFAV